MRCSAQAWHSVVVVVAASALGAACRPQGSAPTGFGGGAGERWTFPLVGPLEEGLLLTPVTIQTHGPYLFALDPDAAISVIDGDLVRAAKLPVQQGAPRLDETGQPQARLHAAVSGLEIGTLIVEQATMLVVRAGTFDSAGRRIWGVLGRDILVDTLAFGFDRDRGLGFLVTQEAFAVPPAARALPFTPVPPPAVAAPVAAPPPPRRVVSATVGTAQLPLHLDLGAVASQLRSEAWAPAGLAPREVRTAVVDEVGTPRLVTAASAPVAVTVGPLAAEGIVFIPYADGRWPAAQVAGTLGLGALAPYDVWLAAPAHTLHLAPRTAVSTAERLRRWDAGLPLKCTHPGCIEVRLVDPLRGAAPAAGTAHPGLVLSITRNEAAGGMPLEVVLEAPAVLGAPALPRLLVNLPPHVDRLLHHLGPAFLGRTVEVVDASPFPRTCPGSNGCVDLLAR